MAKRAHPERVHLLVTRPVEHGLKTKKYLEHAGFQVTLDPLIHYKPVRPQPQWPQEYSMMIATSAHGINCLAQMTEDRTTPLWVVGHHSQKHAQSLGFHRVVCGGGNQNDLMHNLTRHVSPYQGRIVYVSGETIHGALHDVLRDKGYQVQRLIVYRTESSPGLHPQTISFLNHGVFDGVVFLSRETAQVFYHNIARLAYNGCGMMDVFGLSARVLEPLKGVSWRTWQFSARPSWFCLFHLLRSHYYDVNA